MAGLKKLAAVGLAVAFAAVAAYVLRPTAGPTPGTVVVNEPNPDVPTTPDTGGSGDEPTSTEPPAHGLAAQNSNGPNHAVCLPANSHVPEHAADEGANRYRGTCASFAGKGPR